eukprot:TRINITY_DN9802_c0_g1_i1.p1 TRINITY_DN9802_c0_g1~~TRINITY_DN9802_c0_g1_i1.p1  ORF type:complete len:174 (-),score=46.76 TRINITY_DN9802_c0_g1_i1:212-679(-)
MVSLLPCLTALASVAALPQVSQPSSSKTITELVIATPSLSTLLAAVEAADLVGTLSGPGPFTVFAPINKAFQKIPDETLSSLLTRKGDLSAGLLRHVVPAKLKYADVPMGNTELRQLRDKILVNKTTLGSPSSQQWGMPGSTSKRELKLLMGWFI